MPELRMLKQIEPNGSTKTKYMKNNGIADFIKPTIITAQQYGTKVSVEIDHSDTDIDELMYAFQTLIVGLGYSDSAWKNWIVDRADEYKEEAAEEAMYEPSPELRKAAEAYVKVLEEQQMDKELISDFDCTLNDGLDEDEFSNDGGFDGKHVKEDTGSVFFTIPINFYTDEEGNRVYDYEAMADEFEEKLSALDTSAVVMFSVETQPLNKELIKAAAKYKKKLKI
jgi:hypothetical protein